MILIWTKGGIVQDVTNDTVNLQFVPVAGGGAFTIAANSGSYTIAGKPAGFPILAGVGTYTLTGVQAGLSVKLSANSGSYSVIGQDVADLVTTLVATSGVYTLTGTRITLPLSAGHGTYTINGDSPATNLIFSGAAAQLHLLACLGAGT